MFFELLFFILSYNSEVIFLKNNLWKHWVKMTLSRNMIIKNNPNKILYFEGVWYNL
jgi:hypothetical protein